MLSQILKLIRKKEPIWYEPEDSTPKELCPCCDYVSLPERGGYLICPICFWEDDGLDIDSVDSESGPNHMTLRDGRENFKKYGACDKKMIKNVVSEKERKKYQFQSRNV